MVHPIRNNAPLGFLTGFTMQVIENEVKLGIDTSELILKKVVL